MDVGPLPDRLAGLCARHYRRLLPALLLLGLLLRIGAYFELRAADPSFDHAMLDARYYIDWAQQIADGRLAGDRVFFLNPLYAYFLAPLMVVSGEDPLLAIRLAQGLLGLFTIALTAGAVRRFAGPAVGLLAGLFAAAWPLLLYYEQRVMAVTLAVFLNALTLYLLARFAERRTLRAAALASLPLGLSILARPNVALFALLLPLWTLGLGPVGARLRFAVSRTAVLCFVTVLMVLPATLHNWLVGRDFVPVTSTMGVNLWQSNNPLAWSSAAMSSSEMRPAAEWMERDAIRVAEERTGRSLRPSEVSRYWQRHTLSTMGEHPGEAAGFLVRKLLFFLGPTEIASSFFFEEDRRELFLLRHLPLGYWLLAPLMLFGAGFALRRKRLASPLVLLVFAYAVGLTIFFPLAHYRAPMLPAAFGLGALGLLHVLRRLAGGLRGALPALLLFGLCLLPTTLSLPLGRLTGLRLLEGPHRPLVAHRCNRAGFLVSIGEYDRAEQLIQEAMEADPESPIPWVTRAALAQRKEEWIRETQCLSRALELNPANPHAWARLARNQLLRGRVREAAEAADIAAEMAPGEADILVTAGTVFLATGLYERSADALAGALNLGRRDPLVTSNLVASLRLLGRTEDAAAALRAARATDPEDLSLRLEQAALALQIGTGLTLEMRTDVAAARREGMWIPPEIEAWLRQNPR